MTVRLQDGQLPVPIKVDGEGIEFTREHNGDAVEICVEYPDHGSWSTRHAICERYITISREDWNAVIAHLDREDWEDRRDD